MKKFLNWFWGIFKTLLIALLIVIPIRVFIFQPFIVSGESMIPNLENHDYIIVDQLSYRLREPKRGEIVVFSLKNNSQRLIKRIIGLPGEEIEIIDNKINILNETLNEEYISFKEIDNQIISLRDNEYFVLGDNRLSSYDSRRFGLITEEDIIGRAIISVRFFKSISLIRVPDYE